jgi:hypothetical protein
VEREREEESEREKVFKKVVCTRCRTRGEATEGKPAALDSAAARAPIQACQLRAVV